MQSSYIDHRTPTQKNRSNTNIDTFKNYVKIFNDEDPLGKVKLEINFKNNGKILIRNASIYRKNLTLNLNKLKLYGFDIQLTENKVDDDIITPVMITNNHPEYLPQNSEFMRNTYQSSFNQKFINK
tara:strand:+ start:414 stop:791 length:378 start_codon:yes stop_codon:yes gene_type:complete